MKRDLHVIETSKLDDDPRTLEDCEKRPTYIKRDLHIWKETSMSSKLASSTTILSHCRTTGWRRLIGSPKLQIIFHKRATKYRALLQKMTYKDKGSYESSPSCMRKGLSCIYESCLIYIWVVSDISYESCPIWMSHVPYERGMSHMNEACPIWIRHVPYEWGMSHMNEAGPIWMRHVPYQWGLSHINEACPIWMRHVPYEWGMSHMNQTCTILRSTDSMKLASSTRIHILWDH